MREEERQKHNSTTIMANISHLPLTMPGIPSYVTRPLLPHNINVDQHNINVDQYNISVDQHTLM